MQAKLLRVLETGEYQVVGESRTRVADVRVVAITNEDLEARVREGVFRPDLYYRLNVFPIDVPPLRARKEDIPELATYFIARTRGRPGASQPEVALPNAARDVLASYDWPGNVRELRNVVERAVILAGSDQIDASLLRSILGPPERVQVAKGEKRDLHIRRRVELLEKSLIAEALSRVGGRKREAAALLGIDPKNLAYYLRKHEISDGAGESGEEVGP
jgi:Nif-specific regulatory protein